MRRVAVNISINKIRARKNIFKEISESEYEIGYSDSSFDRLNVDQINQLIEKLPIGYRMVFNLYAVEGFSHKEIGEMLNIDEGTSRSQLAKSRKALQAMLHSLNFGRA
jgi:RNA polymerase sigma-70 factor (ECF subfamily)